MCVSILFSLFPKVASDVTEHDGLHNGYSLKVEETAQRIIWLLMLNCQFWNKNTQNYHKNHARTTEKQMLL